MSSQDTNDELNRLLNQSFNDFLKIGEKKKEEKQEELSKGAGKAEATGGEDKKNKTEEQEQLKKKLKEQFEQISAACGQMYDGATEKDFAEQLKSMEELNKKLETAPEDMESVWNQLLTSQPELEQTLQNEAPAMEKIFFEMFFYGMKPLFNTLKDKLPEWVEKNKADLSDTDVERYEKQVVLVKRMCSEMDGHVEGSPTDALVQKMHDITKELERLGTLPKEVLEVTGEAEIPKDCCLM